MLHRTGRQWRAPLPSYTTPTVDRPRAYKNHPQRHCSPRHSFGALLHHHTPSHSPQCTAAIAPGLGSLGSPCASVVPRLKTTRPSHAAHPFLLLCIPLAPPWKPSSPPDLPFFFMHRRAAAASPESVHGCGSLASFRRTMSHPRQVQLVSRPSSSSRSPCTSSPPSPTVPRCVSEHRRVADTATPPF